MTGNVPRRMADVRLGKDACFDAWLYNLFIDNNLVHDLNPHIVASPEQLRFMVAVGPGSVYLPCSDAMFALLCEPAMPGRLQKEYNRAWRILVRLVRSLVSDRMQRRALLLFCRYRFRSAVSQHTLLPPRLIKRMTNIVLAQGLGDGDPWRQRRHALNILQREILRSESVRAALEGMPVAPLPDTLEAARARLDACSLIRHLFLSAYTLELETSVPDRVFLEEEFHRAEQKAADLEGYLDELASRPRTILYLCDADGGAVFDLAVVRKLLRMQHRVIFAVKDGFFFYAPTVDDVEEDPVLREELKQDYIVRDAHLSKNQLLRHLREHRLLVISDGTRERLNLYRVSISFSRAWKEADLILAKGWRSADMLLGTSCEFTRDILCYWHDGADMHLALRRHAPGVKKLTEQDVAAHADGIIARMREARMSGRTVMFYSCIIGSIPGETQTAISLARTFMGDLRKRLDNVLIVNPAEHFVEGMDGDDLMFMWERVQRSGFIDVWRFQTFADIEESFRLMGRKVPPIWSGKDATFSTGCTQEMRIALDVQRQNREMQIIGPDPARFTRRGEYGVGKYFDATISRS